MDLGISNMTEQEQYDHIKERLSDREWRLTSGVLYKIKNKDAKIVPFIPNEPQKQLMRNLTNRNDVLKSRQVGFSTFIDVMALDYALFNKNVSVGVIADTQKNAKTLFNEKIKLALANLPERLRVEFEEREKDTFDEIKLPNGSIISVGTSFRGGTVNFLHISEYGKICAKYPDKGEEILTGAIEAVPPNGILFIESTAEGAYGPFYEISKRAQELKELGKALTSLDYSFHFFPRWQDPSAVLEGDVIITEEMETYFHQIHDETGHSVTRLQKNFYVKKKETLHDNIMREYPSYWEEAFQLAVQGSYFKEQLSRTRREGRITNVPHDPNKPVYVARDLGGFGGGDEMALWFYQKEGKNVNFIDYSATSGYTTEQHWNFVVVPKGYNIVEDWFPHDGKRHESNGKTVSENAYNLGVPVKQMEIGGISYGIDVCRNLFHRCWFDEEKCHEGLNCLSNYARKWDEKNAIFLDAPRKPHWSTHGSDAFRYALVSYTEPAGSRPPTERKEAINPFTGKKIDNKKKRKIDPFTGRYID